jgi:hypothetical protein
LIVSIAFIATFAILKFLHGPLADWCTITYPAEVVVNQDMKVRVQYSGIQEETSLVVDLHWNKKSGERVGYLTTAGYSPRISGEGICDFTLEVADREDIGFVIIVIYLTPTGRWKDTEKAAHSKPIPVVASAGVAGVSKRHGEKTVRPGIITLGAPSGSYVIPEKKDRSRTVLILYVTAVMLSVCCAIKAFGSAQTDSKRTVFHWSITAALMIIGLTGERLYLYGLTGLAREQSRILGWYDNRQIFQRLTIAVLVAAWSSMIFLIAAKGYRRGYSSRLALIFAISLCCIVFVRSTSYHFIDVMSKVKLKGFGILALAEMGFVICICISALYFIAHRQRV